jgi:hypothetical protein
VKKLYFARELKNKIMAVATMMKRPERVVLTYDRENSTAKKTLDFLLSLDFFQVQKVGKSQVEIGLEEYRQGKYTVINKGKKIV